MPEYPRSLDIIDPYHAVSRFNRALGYDLDLLGVKYNISRNVLVPHQVAEDDDSYRRRIIARALGIPEEILVEKKNPKLLTRFQILKNKIE